MPTQTYYVDGNRVPSVTTILARWKESGGLIHWAYTQGVAGLDYRVTRDSAADSGTIAHAMIENFIHKVPLDLSKMDKKAVAAAEHAFTAFREWSKRVKLKIEQTELALVSQKYRFGGTLDAMIVADKLVLGDWKTSSGIYTDHLLQVAGGYSLLWQENFPDQPIEGIEILRISKPEEPGDPISFTDHFWGKDVIPIAQKQFILLREAYDLDKRLKTLL